MVDICPSFIRLHFSQVFTILHQECCRRRWRSRLIAHAPLLCQSWSKEYSDDGTHPWQMKVIWGENHSMRGMRLGWFIMVWFIRVYDVHNCLINHASTAPRCLTCSPWPQWPKPVALDIKCYYIPFIEPRTSQWRQPTKVYPATQGKKTVKAPHSPEYSDSFPLAKLPWPRPASYGQLETPAMTGWFGDGSMP